MWLFTSLISSWSLLAFISCGSFGAYASPIRGAKEKPSDSDASGTTRERQLALEFMVKAMRSGSSYNGGGRTMGFMGKEIMRTQAGVPTSPPVVATERPTHEPTLNPTETSDETTMPTSTPTPLPVITNDRCEDAIRVFAEGPRVLGSTVGATRDNTPTCAFVSNESPGVWFVVEGTGGNLIANTCSDDDYTNFDTKITAFRSCNFGCAGANDDFNCGGNARAVWNSQRNRDYYILVHGFGQNAAGRFSLTVRSSIPLNDRCQEAEGPLEVGDIVFGRTFGATDDFGNTVFNCFTSVGDTPGVWYTVRGSGLRMRADTCGAGTTYDTELNIFDGNCPNLGQSNCIAGNRNNDICGPGSKSLVEWDSVEDRIYFIHVHGFIGASGRFELKISNAPEP